VRHTRRNPQKSQASPVPDPEKIIKERNVLQKGASGSGKSKQYFISLQENSVIEQIHVESIASNTSSEEKILEIHKAPYFLGSSFIVSLKEASPPIHHTPLVLSVTPQRFVMQISSTLIATTAMASPQPTKMERIITASYGPLVLPTPLNSMPTAEYHKYRPKFIGTEGVTAEEHLKSFYSYADNLDISEDDVWMRVFIQSLDGEARKWFKELSPRSIEDIKALDDAFLKHWGDKKDLLYYHAEFGNLKRENRELLSDFNKRLNRMYNKIPAEVKPTTASAKLTYASAFDSNFCLLLRERRCATLADMQEAAFEVESNIMAAKKLKGNVDRRRQRGESSSYSYPKIDKMTKMIESLASEISKFKVEQHPRKGRVPNTFAPRNPNPYRRANEQL